MLAISFWDDYNYEAELVTFFLVRSVYMAILFKSSYKTTLQYGYMRLET